MIWRFPATVSLPARDVLSDDVELIEGERADAVVGRVNTGSAEEFAVEIPHADVPDDPGLFKNLLEVSADESSGQPAQRAQDLARTCRADHRGNAVRCSVRPAGEEVLVRPSGAVTFPARLMSWPLLWGRSHG